MASIRARLERFKNDPTELIEFEAVERACREAKHRWRERTAGGPVFPHQAPNPWHRHPAALSGMFVRPT